MKLRRGLVLVMTAVLIMGAAGCQKQTKGDDTALGEGPMNAVASQSENGSLENGRETVSQEESMGTEGINEIVLNFWYTDAGMTEYFTDAVSRYQKENPGVVINLRMVASTGYLENINTQSIRQTNAVDVYMLHNEDLEQAYLAVHMSRKARCIPQRILDVQQFAQSLMIINRLPIRFILIRLF